MDNPKDVLESMLSRMVIAGWISGYGIDVKNRGLLLEWTDKGTASCKQFRSLFEQLGEKIYADELAAFLTILDDMSPGGTDHAPRHKV